MHAASNMIVKTMQIASHSQAANAIIHNRLMPSDKINSKIFDTSKSKDFVSYMPISL